MFNTIRIGLIKLFFYPSHGKIRLQCALVLYFSLIILGMIPGMRAEAGEYASGAVLHSLAYSAITFLLFTGMGSQSLSNAIACFMLVALMGALDEYIQSFFPYRNGSLDDWIVDIIASFCMLASVLVAWPVIQRFLQRQSKI